MGNEEIIHIFENAYKDAPYQKLLSKLYSSLTNLKGHDRENVKTRWETESNLTLSREEWDQICMQQLSVTSSPS